MLKNTFHGCHEMGRGENEKVHDQVGGLSFFHLTLRAIHHLKSPEEIEIKR